MAHNKAEKQNIFIWGAGGHGRVFLSILHENSRYSIAGFIDDNPNLINTQLDGVPILGGSDILGTSAMQYISHGIIGMGDNAMRCALREKVEALGITLVNAIDKTSIIAPTAQLGTNITIWAGTIINAYALIGDDVIINCGAIIEHENIIKKGAHVGPGAILAGRVTVEERAFVGMGATVKQGVTIGKDSIIGAGAVVLEDIPPHVMAAGVPAKIIKTL